MWGEWLAPCGVRDAVVGGARCPAAALVSTTAVRESLKQTDGGAGQSTGLRSRGEERVYLSRPGPARTFSDS